MLSLLILSKRYLQNLFMAAAALSILLVFVIVFINAFGRYVFNTSFPWGEEAAVFAMIYGVMFGTAAAYLQDKHVQLSVLQSLFPKNLNQQLHKIIDVISFVIGIALVWSGWMFMVRRGGVESPGIGLEMSYFQFAMVLAGALIALAALIKFCERQFLLPQEEHS